MSLTEFEQLSQDELTKLATETHYKLRALLIDIKKPPQDAALLEKYSNELKTAMSSLAELHQLIYKKMGKPLPPNDAYYATEFFKWRERQIDQFSDTSIIPTDIDLETRKNFRRHNHVYGPDSNYTNHWIIVRKLSVDSSPASWLVMKDIHTDLTVSHITAAHSPGHITQIIHGGQIRIDGQAQTVPHSFITSSEPQSANPKRLPEVEIGPDGQITWRIS